MIAAEQPRSLDGGRPIHPCHTLTEKLLECLATIDNDAEAMEHASRAQVGIAKALHERALRLRNVQRAEILEGISVAEKLCSATTGARV